MRTIEDEIRSLSWQYVPGTDEIMGDKLMAGDVDALAGYVRTKMRELAGEIKGHFPGNDPKIEGVSWTLGEIVDQALSRLTGGDNK